MATNQPTPHRTFASLTPVGGPPGRYALDIDSMIVEVGQGPRNDIVLDDDTVSTSHARLEYGERGWLITDLSSKNGTFVDGTRLEPGVPAALPDGATVGFGAAYLTFTAHATPEPVATPSAAPKVSLPRPSAAASTGFRLPVWLFLLIIIVVAMVLAYALGVFTLPTPMETIPEPTALLLIMDVWMGSS